MEMLFLRIVSLILSLLMFLFNTFSTIFPGLFPENPIENKAIVCETEAFEDSENITKTIVSDYISWITVADEDTEGFEEFNWKYFFTGSVALVKVVLPNPDCTVEIESVSENGEVLDIDYKIICPSEPSTDVEETKIILVNISKSISEIDTSGELIVPEEPDTPDIPEIPEEPKSYNYTLCDATAFNDEWYNESGFYRPFAEEFHDYASWKGYYVGSDAKLNTYDAAYFEEKSIVLFYIDIPYQNKEVSISSIRCDSNKNIDMFFRIADSEKNSPAGITAVVIETAKDEKGGKAYSLGLMDEAVVLSSDHLDNYIRKDGCVEIISTYSEWMSYNTKEYYPLVYHLDFSERDLALITVAVPNRDYRIKLDQTKKSGDTVEISYTLYTEENIYYENSDLVYYYIIAAEIPKGTNTVSIKENGFKNKWFSKNFVFVNEPMLISDHETFISVCKSNSGRLSKYDESYFENYSLVAIGGSLPDTSHDFEMIKVKETGETVEIIYGINNIYGGGGLVITPAAFFVEVSKNIKNFSFTRKDSQNHHIKYDELYNFNIDRTPTEEAFLISDFNTWKNYLKSDSEEFNRYNEDYFKNRAIVLVKIPCPSSDSGCDIRYLYEDGNTLHFGYNVYDNGGFSMICYNAVLVEVSNDITQIEMNRLE